MPHLNIHFLDARRKLTPHRSWILDGFHDVFAKASDLCSIAPIDVVVSAAGWVAPNKGHMGACYLPGIINITIDTDNAAFLQNTNHSLERMFAHELHHAMRWDGPGYGETLGEALISEGLAGQFVLQLFGGEPEPWEALDAVVLRDYMPSVLNDWHKRDYDHDAWFFGTKDMPKWLGYSLGFAAVGNYLTAKKKSSAASLAHADAAIFKEFLGGSR
jgi:uncharacterized protein YjaZ